MRLLLSSLTMEAKLSLEALLDLVAVLARDLQDQYLPYFPKVMARCAAAAGAKMVRVPNLCSAASAAIMPPHRLVMLHHPAGGCQPSGTYAICT
jgi:hypothetical protein